MLRVGLSSGRGSALPGASHYHSAMSLVRAEVVGILTQAGASWLAPGFGLPFAVLLQRVRYLFQARWCTSLIPQTGVAIPSMRALSCKDKNCE